MQVNWSLLRKPEPTTLAAARLLAHRALQWPARAALANLAPLPDDSQASFTWDAGMAALLSQPLPGGARAGLHLGVHELVFVKGGRAETFPMIGRPDGEAGAWLDARLAAEGLKPVAGTKLPYNLPPALFARPAEEAKNFVTLSAWFAAGAELLEELRKKYRRRKPGPVRCWPHHFDIAFLVPLEAARSIGIGLSPGDEYYAQPYFYLSPYPAPEPQDLPPLPRGGRWHTRGFFGAVAPATDLFALPDPRAGLLEVLAAAFEESLRRARGK
jgi:hypothetical protein